MAIRQLISEHHWKQYMKNDKKEFKAVEFMRAQRDRLTALYHKDKDEFMKELDRSHQNFLKLRKKKLHSA